MINSHTPGPWLMHKEMIEQVSGDPYEVFSVGYADEGKVDYSNSDPWQEICGDIISEANARLMAAAPEMLDALRDAFEFIRDEHGDGPTLRRIAAAIKSAKEGK